MSVDHILYDTLGIQPNYSSEQIKEAFNRIIAHLDKNTSSDERLMIDTAYEILMNPELRKIYDSKGLDFIGKILDDKNLYPDETDSEDEGYSDDELFEEEEEISTEAKEQFIDLDVSMKDLYLGTSLPLRVQVTAPCRHCHGTCTHSGRGHPMCPACGGSGRILVRVDPAFGALTAQQVCLHCFGRGFLQQEADTCRRCFGRGTELRGINIKVDIERGMREGDRVRVPRYPGVYVVVHEKRHSRFIRFGNDLAVKKELNLAQALCGTNILIEHLDGRKLVSSTSGMIIRPGQVMAVKGEGFPVRGKKKNGDLYIKFDVKFPDYGELTPLLKSCLMGSLFPQNRVKSSGELVEAETASIEEFGNGDHNSSDYYEEDSGSDYDYYDYYDIDTPNFV